MNTSYLYSTRTQCDLSKIHLFVLPEWMEITLKSQGLTLDRVFDMGSQAVLPTIFSGKDLEFHDQVSHATNELLFGSHKLMSDKEAFTEQLEKVRDAWFAIPFGMSTELNLHPVVVSSNLIAIINLKGDDAKSICETDIYERLLKCIHRLLMSQVGTKAWECEFVRAVLEKIQVGRLAA